MTSPVSVLSFHPKTRRSSALPDNDGRPEHQHRRGNRREHRVFKASSLSRLPPFFIPIQPRHSFWKKSRTTRPCSKTTRYLFLVIAIFTFKCVRNSWYLLFTQLLIHGPQEDARSSRKLRACSLRLLTEVDAQGVVPPTLLVDIPIYIVVASVLCLSLDSVCLLYTSHTPACIYFSSIKRTEI